MTCQNCGRQATGNFCPGCGTRLSAQPAPDPGTGQGRPSCRRRAKNRNDRQSLEYPQNREHVYRQINAQQSFRQGSAPGQYAFPGYVPSQGYNPGRQETGVYQDIPAWAAGQSPGGQLLMRLAGSPIMLICAILASLYALSMCYLCGKEIVHLIGEIGDHYKYYITAQKIVFPAEAANKDWTGEFLQYYFSEESAAYNATNGCIISPYYAANSEAVQAEMTPFTIDAFAAADANTVLYPLAKGWYKEWWDVYQNTLTALVSGDIDAPEFCQQMEDATAALRADDSIVKYSAG